MKSGHVKGAINFANGIICKLIMKPLGKSLKIKASLTNRNSFLRHVMVLTSGSVIAQIITLLVSPIITRMYSPEDMGYMASLLAISTILGVIGSGRYELAIVLPEDDKDGIALAYLGAGIAFCGGLGILLLFVFCGKLIVPFIGMKNVPLAWTYVLGPIVFLIGMQQVLTRTSIRNKKFKALASTQATQAICTNGVKIGMGFFNAGVMGLFSATVAGNITRSVRLLWEQRLWLFNRNNIPSLKDLLIQAKRYKKFPLISSWSVLLNSASIQLPVILFSSLYSPAFSGCYALSYRVLSVPMALIGKSVGDVFIERAARSRNNPDELKRITLSIFKRLLIIGTLSLSGITFYGDIIFPFIFGNNWVEAGRYAQWISLWLIFVLAASPLSTLYTILEKQGESLFFNVIIFVSRIAVIGYASLFSINEYKMIIMFSLVGAILWLIMCFRILFLLHIKGFVIFRNTVLIFVPILLGQWLLSLPIRSIIWR